MQPHHKIIAGVFAAVVILALILLVVTHPQVNTQTPPAGTGIATSAPGTSAQASSTTTTTTITTVTSKPPVQGIAIGEPYPITIEGTPACLPVANENGIHSTLCALGLKTANGTYYALHDTDPGYKNVGSFTGDATFQIKGVMHPDTSPDRLNEGTIDVESVTKVK